MNFNKKKIKEKCILFIIFQIFIVNLICVQLIKYSLGFLKYFVLVRFMEQRTAAVMCEELFLASTNSSKILRKI